MPLYLFYIAAYASNITACIGGCSDLLLRRPYRQEQNPVYLKACYSLALATFLVALGHVVSQSANGWKPVPLELFSFPVTLIASSQAILFTFSLILLFNTRYVTWWRILLHAAPTIIFTLLYAGACLIWEDHYIYEYSQLKIQAITPPLLIRMLYMLVYIVQLGIYIRLFMRERRTYLALLGEVKPEDRWLKLGQVTYAFFSAFAIGLCALSLALNPQVVHEVVVIFIFAAFYMVFANFYANFDDTYHKVRIRIQELDETLPPPPPEADMEELICYLQPEEDNHLFKEIEAYFQKEQPYLDPNFKISDLPRAIGANQHKLAITIGCATGLTVQNYILRLRIRHAMDLLLLQENATRKIEDIALSSGFDSTRTFNRNFRELVKTTPTQFRNRNR